MAHVNATPVSLQTKPRRKRRPTRTPKPSTGFHASSCATRLCSPSPYLDRSFERKKLFFGQARGLREHDSPRGGGGGDDAGDDAAARESADETESSEYVPDTELEFDDGSDSGYHSYPEQSEEDAAEHKQQQQQQASLADQIENLQINSNQPRKVCGDSRSKPSTKLRNPKIGKKSATNSENKKQTQTQTLTQTQIRITKSQRVFKRLHEFLNVLVAPSECGSGCPLFCSRYKTEATVTKLLPLFANEEFSKEENVENALREFELHADVYRKGVKRYGVHDSPTVAIYACVSLKHDERPYLAFVMPQLHCNLAQFVRRYRRLTADEGRALFCAGLRFLRLLRDADIVHCDIKPENIFVGVVDAHKIPSRPTKAQRAQIRIDRFVFADFGCAAVTTEEFPYGNLTGTITMWDSEALGRKFGAENGFDARNDLYGVIGSLFDAMYGGSLIEELLQELDEDWEASEWEMYGTLVRKSRKQIVSAGYLEPVVRQCIHCDDETLNTVLLQLGKPRKQRMSLQRLMDLLNID